MGKKQAKGNLLPFSLVEQAASGDIEAIDRVLRHYAGYIRTLATGKFYDEYGTPRICVDEEMCKRLEIKLITPIAIEEGLRFAIREGGRTVGSGVVTAINE